VPSAGAYPLAEAVSPDDTKVAYNYDTVALDGNYLGGEPTATIQPVVSRAIAVLCGFAEHRQVVQAGGAAEERHHDHAGVHRYMRLRRGERSQQRGRRASST
jgi:hypothetical protein